MKPKKGQFNFDKIIAITSSPGDDGETGITATHLGRQIGHMTLLAPWKDPQREVAEVVVNRKYRRQGIGSAMWKHAKDAGLNPKHSTSQTQSGKTWAKKVGD